MEFSLFQLILEFWSLCVLITDSSFGIFVVSTWFDVGGGGVCEITRSGYDVDTGNDNQQYLTMVVKD